MSLTGQESQVLQNSSKVSYFGYSLSAADVDLNGYSDVAVGALSGGVTLFRSRPIIDLQAVLKTSVDKFEKGIKLENSDKDNVEIQVCFGFSERSGTLDTPIKVKIYNS